MLTLHQNEIAAPKNQHILEDAHALIFSANMPKMFQWDDVITSIHLINRVLSRVRSFQTPLQKFQKLFPTSLCTSSLPLKVLGCTTFLHVYKK